MSEKTQPETPVNGEILVQTESLIETPAREQRVQELISSILRKERALSYSSLSAFRETPRDFIEYMFREKVQTEDMLLGSVMHKLVLQPDTFNEEYFVINDIDKKKEIGGGNPAATNAFKAWRALMDLEANGKQVVTQSTYNLACQMRDAIRRNRAAQNVISRAREFEKAVSWEYNDLLWKGFIDGDGPPLLFDLKKVTDANPRKVNRDILQNGYYLQGAMYLTPEGDFSKHFYNIAIDPKLDMSVSNISKELIDKGRKEYDFLVDQFCECIVKGRWDESYEFYSERRDGSYEARKLW